MAKGDSRRLPSIGAKAQGGEPWAATMSTCTPFSETEEGIRILEPYLKHQTYRAGEVLWLEGDESGELVLLDRGRVKAVKEQPDGRSILLYVFSPGDLFGFLPFVDGGPYPATSVAVEEVEARTMSRAKLLSVLRRDPDLAMVLLEMLGLRLRQALDRVADQTRRSAVSRVAAGLLLLLPDASVTGIPILDVPEPMHDFAAELGLTPETFSRSLTKLVQAGILHRLSPPGIQVLDVDALRATASGRILLTDTGSGNKSLR